MKSILVLFFLIVSLHASSQIADFYKEELQFTVDSTWFRMQGDFYLARQTPFAQEMQLSFPVPNGTMALIDSFFVYDYRSQKTLKFQRGVSEFIFVVPFSGADSVVVNIQYRQLIKDSALSYIITTVQKWHRPLRYASYSLFVPHYCVVSDFSLEPNKAIKLPKATMYLWERLNFMPQCDFNFRYQLCK